MEPLTLILIGIIGLFFVVLGIKNIFNSKKICAICSSVTLTWLILLNLYFIGIFQDKIIIGIFMGMTALGIYYTLEKKVKEKFLVFRLPFLLTLIFIIYTILNKFLLESLILLVVLWMIFTVIYLFKFNKFAKKIIECCKKW